MSNTTNEGCSLTPCMSKPTNCKTKHKSNEDKGKESTALSSKPAKPDKNNKGKDASLKDADDQDPNKELKGKPLLFTGVLAVGVIKKILLPSACASLAAAAVSQSSETKDKKGDKALIRPRDLPIYSNEPTKEKTQVKCQDDSAITATIRELRKSTWAVIGQAKVYTNQACDVLETGKAHTASTITYLREDENAIPRYGAIGLGGLVGLLVGLRHGLFKRLLYTSTGTLGMAATLYPQEAREYTSEGIKTAKKYIIVGYHFINGDESKGEKKLKKRTSKEKKQISDTNKTTQPDCLCPDKNNKCPDPSDNGKDQ